MLSNLPDLQWAGHVARMDDSRMPSKAFEKRFYNNRARGRPRKRWLDVAEEVPFYVFHFMTIYTTITSVKKWNYWNFDYVPTSVFWINVIIPERISRKKY